MKTTTSCYLALTTLAVALTPFSFGQAVTGATNAALQSANAASAAARATPAAIPSVAASGQAAAQQSAAASNAAASAQGAAMAAAHSPAVTGVTSTGAAATTAAGASIPTTHGTVNAGMANSATTTANASHGNGADASTQAGLNGTSHAPGLNGSASGQVSVSLNTTETTTQIRNSTFETRDTVITQVDSTLKTTHVAMAQLRQRGSQLSGDARAQFKSAYEQLRLREQALRESLRNARQASASTYADAQAKLASDYDAYAQAVAAAEAAGAVSATTK